jgi:integrase
VQLFATRPPEIRPAKHTTRTATTWIALIAAYSGARLEELAQLSAGDVRKVDGVLCFDLHRGNGNKIKTGAGVRFVPVHSKLVAAGFLKYRDTLPSGSRLFPGLSNKNNKDEKFGGAVSDAFRRWLAEAGLKRPGLVLHSMRHTVRTKIRNSGFAESFIDWITGHEQGTIGGNYGEAPEPKVLAKAIEKINYAGLKLTAK